MKLYYQNPNVTLYKGDCMEVMRALPCESFDLAFTSPPYNLREPEHVGSFPANGLWRKPQIKHGYAGYGDNLPHWKYVQWQRGVQLELWRLINVAGAVMYNHKPRAVKGNIRLPLEFWTLPLRQIVIWSRSGGMNFSRSHYLPMHEWVLIGAKPDFRLKNKGASGVGDVWHIPTEQGNEHPAPFPVSLPARAIETTGCKTVIDPFAGSGSVLIAAMQAGIHATGIERHEGYCKMIAERCEREAGNRVINERDAD